MDELDAFLEDAAVGDDVGGVAGHVDALEAGAGFQELVGELVAVHAGHDDVGEEEVDGAVVGGGEAEGGCGVGSGEYAVAQGAEHGFGDGEDGGFVLDEENGFLSGGGGGGGWGVLGGRFGAVFEAGEADAERAAAAGPAVDVDEALVLLDDAVDGGEAEAGAEADGFGGEEGFESVGDGVGVHAAAIVADGEAGICAGDAAGIFGAEGFVDADGLGADGDGAAVGHGVARIDAEVGEDLVDLGRIHLDGDGDGGGEPFEVDVFADEAAEHVDGTGDGVVEVEDAGHDGLLASEGEELAGQFGGAFGGLLDFAHAIGGIHAGFAGACGEFDVAEDDLEHVVEVVGDAAGEAADGIDALHLVELGLEAFLVFFGLLAPEGLADVVGDAFDGFDQGEGEEVFIAAAELEEADDFRFGADGNEGDGCEAFEDAAVAGGEAGVLAGRDAEEFGRIVGPAAAAGGGQGVCGIGLAAEDGAAGADEEGGAIGIADDFAKGVEGVDRVFGREERIREAFGDEEGEIVVAEEAHAGGVAAGGEAEGGEDAADGIGKIDVLVEDGEDGGYELAPGVGLAEFGDVARDAQEGSAGTGGIGSEDAVGHVPAPGSVLVADAVLDAGLLGAAHGQGHGLAAGIEVVGMYEIREGALDDFGGIVAKEIAPIGRNVVEGAVVAECVDDVVGVFDEGAEAVFAFPEGGFGAYFFGDVDKALEEELLAAEGEGNDGFEDGNALAGGPDEDAFGAVDGLAEVADGARMGFGGAHEAVASLADDLVLGESDHGGGGGIDLDDDAGCFFDEHEAGGIGVEEFGPAGLVFAQSRFGFAADDVFPFELLHFVFELADEGFVVLAEEIAVGGGRGIGAVGGGEEDAADCGKQFVGFHGLDEEGVAAEGLGKLAVFFVDVGSGIEDEGDGAEGGVVLPGAAQGEAVHFGHEDVGDDQVRFARPGDFEGIEAVGGGIDGKTGTLEDGIEIGEVGGNVVGDQNAFAVHGRKLRRHPPGRILRTPNKA